MSAGGPPIVETGTAFEAIRAAADSIGERFASAIEGMLTEEEKENAYLKITSVHIDNGRVDRSKLAIEIRPRPKPRPQQGLTRPRR